MGESEKKLLCKSHDPAKVVWVLWSAKESAFKALKKLLPDLIFSPSKFRVKIDQLPRQIEDPGLFGRVYYGDYKLLVSWEFADLWLHCVATLNYEQRDQIKQSFEIKHLDEVEVAQESFSPAELLSIHSQESMAVRALGKMMLAKMGLVDAQIIRLPLANKFAPPAIYCNSYPVNSWDLSMSHDGNFVACALTS